ncbi:MAG: endonuclease III domain-containing protein [Terriglobales bacterium]
MPSGARPAAPARGAAALPHFAATLAVAYAGVDGERWWPGGGGFEVMVGALLVQNTAWNNAAKALAALRRAGRLSPHRIAELSEAELGALIRSSGCWRQKARRLRALAAWLVTGYGGSVERLFAQPAATVRALLLEREGVGEETADTMLLYAGSHPRLIVDSYMRRLLERHGIRSPRERLERSVPRQAVWLRRWHALVVENGKRYCHRREPDCHACPLGPLLARIPSRQGARSMPAPGPARAGLRRSQRRPHMVQGVRTPAGPERRGLP